MGELEGFKEQVTNACKQHFSVFPLMSAFEDDADTLWYLDDDINSFLSMAKAIGIKLMYIYTSESDDPGHQGEIDSVHVAFNYEGFIHLFVKDASWAKDSDDE